MSNRISALILGSGIALGLLAGSLQAQAAPSVQKQCGEEWAAAKKAGTVPTGTTWPKFLGECKTRHASDAAVPAKPTVATAPPPVAVAPKPVAVAPTPAPKPIAVAPTPATKTMAAAPAPAPVTGTVAPTTKATGGREAMVERERTCGARWKQIKGTAALPAGITTWPKYWSWCNTQIKDGKTI